MKINKYLYSLIAVVMMLFTAGCSPDDYSMGDKGVTSADLKEGIAFSITPDASNPNLIHLQNLMTGYNAYWIHPGVGTNHSKGDAVDLKIAFPGSYKVVFGVDTKGGMVYSDTVTVDVTSFCPDFVTGDDWTNLTNGAGNSKTWVPDNGKYGMKQGFYSCFAPAATAADMTHDEGMNNWYAKGNTWWEPSNADVGITADDLAQTMTFSLKGGAGLTVTDASGKATTGTFAFDPDSHSLSADGVEFAHGAWANGKSKSFSKDFYVFLLNKNQMMIANKRDPALSGEGECWYVWNFVSKDYADNYKPTEVTEPTLPDGWNTAITQQTNTTITWVLSKDTPFDWFTLAGTRKDNYASAGDYPSFFTPSSDIGENIKLTMNSAKNTYSLTNNGADVASGTYTLSDKGVYTFSNGLGKILIGGDWVYLSADDDNQLRILTYDVKATTGKVNNLWLGAKEKDLSGNMYQYLGYHFVAVTYGDVKTYDATLNYFSHGWNYTQASDPLSIEKEGQYTVAINGSNDDPYGLYMDVKYILADHPKARLTLDDVKVDGTSIPNIDYSYAGFTTNSDGTQLVADAKTDPTTARIYVLNPWDKTGPFYNAANVVGDTPYFPMFKFTSSIAVTFTVKFND
jgi:hypothetical protein